MDLWIVLVLYVVGLGMIVAETMMPGLVVGLIGTGILATSVVFGFRHHWAIGAAQLAVALVVAPLAFRLGLRRLALEASLEGGVPFAQDYSIYMGQEGESLSDLRPAGIVMIDGKKVDVVTGGELIPRGRRVRVVQVEGNRVVVRAVQGG